jgi:hypothetical protein
MISIIDHLMEGASKLLTWMDKCLKLEITHLESLNKRICL